MYELVQVSENCYYIESPAKIGLVKIGEDEVVIIDSGNDKEAGRKVRQILDKNNWKLKAIYNTHSNADHIGGNKYLQDQTGCKIYASGIECDFTNHPSLEGAFLFGGYPPKDLRHKSILAKASNAEPLTEEVLPEGFKIINLPGHFFDMVGFETADGIIYLADCLSSREILDKYQISFVYDVAKYIETLEMIKTLKAKLFIPAHAKATEEIYSLAEYNIQKIYEVKDKIKEICKEKPLNYEEILKKLFDEYNLTMSVEQYALIGSSLKSYLSWMNDLGKIELKIEDNKLLWY